jgi:hypothetical protein
MKVTFMMDFYYVRNNACSRAYRIPAEHARVADRPIKVDPGMLSRAYAASPLVSFAPARADNNSQP